MYEREREIDDRQTSDQELRELAAIEAELAALRPGPGRLDRDRTMFLAGRASVGSETVPAAPKVTSGRWATALAAMTAVAGCLLVAVVVQQRSIIALRTEEPAPIAETVPEQAPAQPVEDAPNIEPPSRRAFVDDFQRNGFDRRRFDFSEQRLLALADSGTLTARSFYMIDDPWTTAAKPAPASDWPQQTYEPRSAPLPYYKLLKQLQEAGI